ncbi:hypothetical protein Pmani_037759 [Petrolisthes manimaculis]|uniref:Uncharacterized protein n=1 Tax=Petrolisthes manimaculis TaxID=1843537 RepID=A0AAE1NHK7_9EUCA|nr:hypothetical protein Pmani_037759 [Petrolisthes manimaculis]
MVPGHCRPSSPPSPPTPSPDLQPWQLACLAGCWLAGRQVGQLPTGWQIAHLPDCLPGSGGGERTEKDESGIQ